MQLFEIPDENNTAAKHVNDGIDNAPGFGVFAVTQYKKVLNHLAIEHEIDTASFVSYHLTVPPWPPFFEMVSFLYQQKGGLNKTLMPRCLVIQLFNF